MGIWGGTDPVPVDVAKIATIMRPVLYAWFNGRLKFFDPGSRGVTRYSGTTDTGGVNPAGNTLIFDTLDDGALIQPIRSASRLELGGQANDLVGIRFQIKRDSTLLRGGLLVQVVDGGEDVTLPKYTFELQEAIDSSLGWGRILEATVVTGGVS